MKYASSCDMFELEASLPASEAGWSLPTVWAVPTQTSPSIIARLTMYDRRLSSS